MQKCLLAIFTKPCRITDYSYVKKPVNFGVDLNHMGDGNHFGLSLQYTAYYLFYIHSLDSASVLHRHHMQRRVT